MKRALLGTTAIVGIGLLAPMPAVAQEAQEPELSISGYARVEAWWIDQDVTTGAGRGFHMETDDAEIRFDGRAVAENGLQYRAHLELDMDANVATDEIWLRFQGPWGQLELGDQDGAEDVMLHDGTVALTAQGGYDGGAGSAFSFLGVRAASPDLAGDTGDATKISFFTPRLNSIQLGFSITPDTGHNLSDALRDGNAGNQEVSVGFGVNFVQSINDVSVNLGAVGVTATSEVTGREDDGAWAAGANFGTEGFTIGASYGDSGKSRRPANDGSDSGQYWEIAGGYSTGPASFHIGFFHGDADNAVGLADDETDFFTIGANYSLAPGLRVYAEWDVIDVDQPGAAADNDGNVLMIGTNFSF